MAVEHVERLRVAWVDTDAGGRIHFSNAFRWAEQAETSLRRKLGILEGWSDYPRKRAEAEFHQVLRFEDEIDVRVTPERLGERRSPGGSRSCGTASCASRAGWSSSTSARTAAHAADGAKNDRAARRLMATTAGTRSSRRSSQARAGRAAFRPTLAVKDLFDTAGIRYDVRLEDLRRPRPRADGGAVERLLDAGAVLVGKTHLPEFAWSVIGVNPWHGTCHNPAQPGKTTGGSSSGNAAALAAGLCGSRSAPTRAARSAFPPRAAGRWG